VPDRDKIFQPRLIYTLSQYNLTKLRADVLAGITVGLVALPLAMAFAIASGVRPEAGLFTAIVAGFLISALAARAYRLAGPPARSSCWCTGCSPPMAWRT